MNKLKVGDIIYHKQYGNITRKYTIHRVTEKMAFAKVNNNGYELKFNIEYSSWLKIIGKPSRFDTSSYHVETTELKEKYERMVIAQKLSQIVWDKFPIDAMRNIMAIVSKVELTNQPPQP